MHGVERIKRLLSNVGRSISAILQPLPSYSMWSSTRVNIRSSFFNTNMCDMFFEKYECDIASYADDNKPHTYDSDLYTVLSKLKNFTDSLFTWFKENHMKPTGDKCHLFVTTEKSVSINIDGSNVENKKEQKLLSIKFDSSLSFKGHITSLCKKLVKSYMH